MSMTNVIASSNSAFVLSSKSCVRGGLLNDGDSKRGIYIQQRLTVGQIKTIEACVRSRVKGDAPSQIRGKDGGEIRPREAKHTTIISDIAMMLRVN